MKILTILFAGLFAISADAADIHAIEENSFLVLPTNRPFYLAAPVYVSNALVCAKAHYPKIMARLPGTNAPAAHATIRISELVDPTAPVHVVFSRSAPSGSLYAFDSIHVVLGRNGNILSHEKWPNILTEEDLPQMTDPEQTPAGDRVNPPPEE